MRFPGGMIPLPVMRPTSLSVAVQSAGSALVTVHHGKVNMAPGGKSPVEVTTGETVRITPDGPLATVAPGFAGRWPLPRSSHPRRLTQTCPVG